jgi:hypothetical protein
MDKIKRLLFTKVPQTRQLLLPTIYKERNVIKPNELITANYKNLTAKSHLGDQYEYLARFAEEEKAYDLELCIGMCYPGFFSNFIKPLLIKEPDGKDYNYRLADEPSNADLALFKYFRFPIHHLSKFDLQQEAIKHGFINIINETWFCHSPKNHQPCGLCTPCRVTMEEGMRRRIPLIGQLRNFVKYKAKPPLKQILRPLKRM